MGTPKLLGVPCWAFPVIAGTSWLFTLITLITIWVLKGSTHYPEMWPAQQLPYISNIGASPWGQPLFIIGSSITIVSFWITFVSERWLRHKGCLIHSHSKLGSLFWVVAALLTTTGTIAQILLTVFCIRKHSYTHYSLVAVFALAYIFAAAFICAERKTLINRYPLNRTLRNSFHIKLFFIATEIILVTMGSIFMFKRLFRAAIIIEWIAALFFTFYISSFAIDFFAIPTPVDKDEAAQLLDERQWDEEAGLAQPTKLYVLRGKCIAVQ